MTYIPVAAHRGNSRYFPENTLKAYRSGIELGADQIEIDLHMTRDGDIVMIHDHTVDRTTDGEGLVREKTTREILALDAGRWKGEKFIGTRIPLFGEFLDILKYVPNMTVNVELKDYPTDRGEEAFVSADRSLAMLREYGVTDRCVFNSWSGEILEYLDEKYDHSLRLHGYYPLSSMGKITKDPYDILYCICLFGPKDAPVVDKEHFDYAASRGVQPWVYYSDEQEEYVARAASYGARLFTSNDPLLTIQRLEKLGYREGKEAWRL